MANKKTGKTGTHLSADTSPVQCSLDLLQVTLEYILKAPYYCCTVRVLRYPGL